MLTDEQVMEFKRIYEAYFEEEISFAEASDKAHRLLAVLRIVLQPLTKKRVLLHLNRSHSRTTDKS